MGKDGTVPLIREGTTTQAEVLALLQKPEAYGPAVSAVQRIDTFISIVFLAGDSAFKMKRAVRLPFLDFTTLERRHKACLAELAINRRTAPSLYLGVEPVMRRPDGSLTLGGEGEPVEWVVRMRRFEDAGLFDRMAADGRLDVALLRRLADRIADFHQAAERRPDWGGARGLKHTIVTNARTFAEAPAGLFDPARIDALTEKSLAELDRLTPLLEERRERGFVRLCHGDLHLSNICLVDGEPTLFDAIEFNDEFAAVDRFYDLSFLLMDLDARGLRPLANAVFNRYLERIDDLSALPALPLFLSLRAAIRAHVAGSSARLGETGDARAEALRYLALAQGYLEPAAPCLVAIGGLSGTGKSTLAQALAPSLGAAPGALVLRSDVLRKRLMGVAPEVHLPPEGYSPAMTEATYRALMDDAARALDAGISVVTDAVFATPSERDALERLARSRNLPFRGIWLQAGRTTLLARVAERKADASDATTEVVERQLAFNIGEIAWTAIDASGTKEACLAAVSHELRQSEPMRQPPMKGGLL